MKKFFTVNRNICFCILFVASFFSFSAISHSQTFDTKGTDFIMTFMPNFHSYGYADEDSVFIYVTIEEPTDINIEITDANGRTTKKIQTYLSDVNQMSKFAFRAYDYELANSFPGSLTSFHDDNEETPVHLSARITSTKEINVYGLSSAQRSSDAFLIMPTDVLADNYYVLSYYSDKYDSEYYNVSNTPSQFAVVANEDATTISITPSVRTSLYHQAGVPYSVTLNKGEVYLVCSNFDDGINADLTGTHVTGNKPFALFAGQQRATIPHKIRVDNPNLDKASRDFICSQIPPVSTWGKNAFVIPFPQMSDMDEPDKYHDVYRILSASDGNEIDINGTKITLDKGKFYEGDLIKTAISITATAPILVAQYKRTSSISDRSEPHSDPLFLVIPPKEQFVTSAKLLNMDRDSKSRNFTFPEQYIFIVCPNQYLSTCKLDNVNLAISAFEAIPESDYSYCIRTVDAGIHQFSSDAKCGLYVVGYGYANSYGYVGGMQMRNINDSIPPSVTTEKSCFRHICSINDANGESDGIKNINVIDSLTDNITINLPDDIYGQSKITFTANLTDETRDGYFTVEITDRHNNSTTYSDTVQGKTLMLDYIDGTDNNCDSVMIGSQKCISVNLRNAGILPWQLDGNLFLRNGIYFSVPQSQFPMSIQPGESKELTLCTLPLEYDKTNPVIYDTLDLNFGCYANELPVSVIPQKIIRQGTSKCGLPVSLTISSVVNSLIFENVRTIPSEQTLSLIYGIPSNGFVSIQIFDTNGNLLDTVFNGEQKTGLYEVGFNCANLASGTYFIRLSHSAGNLTRKVIIDK